MIISSIFSVHNANQKIKYTIIKTYLSNYVFSHKE